MGRASLSTGAVSGERRETQGGPPPGARDRVGSTPVIDPAVHAVIDELLRVPGTGPLAPRELDAILRRHPKEGRGFYSKREILRAFRQAPAHWGVPEPLFAERLRTCPTRSRSGILPVTVLTRPFPCPGRCIFCPDDVRMPKSYLADEPGCQRALQHRFDPYAQTWSRLDAYREMGHCTDKVELIVLGGTWSALPEPYQRWFVARCLEALNDFGGGVARRPPSSRAPRGEGVGAADRMGTGRAEPARGRAGWDRVLAAQRANERAGARCVGLSLETRPDHVTRAELERLRRLGATKIQLGLQSLDDAVLAANRRGHDVACSRAAMERLRAAGFKLQVHWMPNLHGATPEGDRRDFARLFDDPALRPDELKIYPCSLIETAELMRVHARGEWRPYRHEVLVDLLADCLVRVPAWCRVTRVIRDIPSPDIVEGNRQTNLREVVEARLRERSQRIVEIRSREVGQRAIRAAELVLGERCYATSRSDEHFLEWSTTEGRIAGFARLSLPRGEPPLEELCGRALLREVHVYGPVAGLGERGGGRAQHAGLGGRLVARAAEIAEAAGYAGLAVISSVGTRGWYRRLGFRDGGLYQHLAFAHAAAGSRR